MISHFPLNRAVRRLLVPATGLALLICASPAQAFTPTVKGSENTRLDVTSGTTAAHTASSDGPSLTRTIVGLLIVIAVIWGLTWVLRQVKSGRDGRAAGAGLTSVATLPLGSGRTLHLVRAGREYLLVGSAEHGVVPIHRYSEEQARELGLLDRDPGDDESDEGNQGSGAGGWPSALIRARSGGQAGARPLQMPGQRRAGDSPAANLVDRLREWTVRR
ncbi:MAG TPA: flagellar biosynthetic protein FliO [Solirubrobacteraceae bacterium]|nr:flagellar biosynthetic protein FliO [Solirubrobacteraceae bacterium]